MTKDELIANQQLEIESLKQDLKLWNEAADMVHAIIFSIGGPLNDNKKGYTHNQRDDFSRISRALNFL